MIRHHICACLWELAAAVFCSPSLTIRADHHRRAAVPSRQTPLSCYRIPSEQESEDAINAQVQKSLADTKKWTDFNKGIGDERRAG